MRPVSEEIAIAVADCPHCMALKSAPCFGHLRKPMKSGMHGTRLGVAQSWRKDHRAEYRAMRAKLLQEREPEYGVAGGEC